MSASQFPDHIPSDEDQAATSSTAARRPRLALDKIQSPDFAEAIIETVPTPLLVLDGTLVVVMANDAFYHHFRVTPADTIGQAIWLLGNGQWNIVGLRRLLIDVLPRNASVVNYEVTQTFPEIGQRTMLLNGRTVFPRHGRAQHILLVIQDITAQRNAERDLQEANKQLQHTNEEIRNAYQELESFSYSVSHDLRAPLRGIEGFSLALLEDYGATFDTVARDYLGRIRAGTVRMAKLIDDILQLSRLSRVTMEPTDVDLRAEAVQIIGELRKADPARKATFTLPEQATAVGDRQLIVIALTNLLNNAWKFTANTPSAVIEFGVQKNQDQQVFFVRDNGVGFDAKYAEKIFEPFNRLHSAQEYPGSGIGLAIVNRVVRRHRGLIWATGVRGQGATFYFTLTPDNPQ